MKDPEMAGRRVRTREGRERKRVRKQRPKLLLILGSGLVMITLMGLTAWNVLSRIAEKEGRIEKESAKLNTQLDAATEEAPDPLREAVVPDKPAEAGEPADSAAAVKVTVSEKQVALESARDRFLARSAGQAEDSEAAVEAPAEVEPEAIDEAEKERVLRKVMPFYRSPKESEAPPVPAEELYIPKPK